MLFMHPSATLDQDEVNNNLLEQRVKNQRGSSHQSRKQIVA